MSTSTNMAREMATLPAEAQKEVLDFMAFLKTRCRPARAAKKTRRPKLADEPFVGMWRTRRDVQDSSAWVRDLRRREWEGER